MATPRGPNLKIQPFDGEKEVDFKAWLENEFDLKFKANNWSEELKGATLPGYLQGHAAFLYRGLPAETRENYDATVTALETKLMTNDQKRFLNQQYESRVQKPTETVNEYARALSDLAKSALSYMTVEAEKETNLRDKFINGLRPEIGSNVALMGPDTLTKALTAAVRVEASSAKGLQAQLEQISQRLDGLDKAKGKGTSSFSAKQLVGFTDDNAFSSTAESGYDHGAPSWVVDLKERINSLELATSANTRCPKTRNFQQRTVAPGKVMYPRQQVSEFGRLLCQICNKPNHTAANCRFRNRYCEYHRTSAHDSSECRARNNGQQGRGGYQYFQRGQYNNRQTSTNHGGQHSSTTQNRHNTTGSATCNYANVSEKYEAESNPEEVSWSTFVGTLDTCDQTEGKWKPMEDDPIPCQEQIKQEQLHVQVQTASTTPTTTCSFTIRVLQHHDPSQEYLTVSKPAEMPQPPIYMLLAHIDPTARPLENDNNSTVMMAWKKTDRLDMNLEEYGRSVLPYIFSSTISQFLQTQPYCRSRHPAGSGKHRTSTSSHPTNAATAKPARRRKTSRKRRINYRRYKPSKYFNSTLDSILEYPELETAELKENWTPTSGPSRIPRKKQITATKYNRIILNNSLVLFFTILAVLFFKVCAHPKFPNPLLCQTNHNSQLWKLPDDIKCTTSADHKSLTPVSTTLQLYKHNIVQYQSTGWLCQKQTVTVKTLSYFFGDENLKKSDTHIDTLSAAECAQMKSFNQCSAGKLQKEGELWLTNNNPDWHYPGGGINCCHWKTFQATNCFLYKVKVYKRHGDTKMESTAGDVAHCTYSEGRCSLQNGYYLMWTPNKTEACNILPWKQVTGNQRLNNWLADDGNLALTFNKSRKTHDCKSQQITVSDQGIPFRTISRVKRNVPTGIITSEILAASLQALEEHTKRTMLFSFNHAMTSTCNSMKNVYRVLKTSILANPTAAMRVLLNVTSLIANAGGNLIQVWPCLEVPVGNFTFKAMSKVCTKEVPIKLHFGSTVRHGYLDTTTNIVYPYYTSEVACELNSAIPLTIGDQDYIYSRTGTIHKVNKVQTINPFEMAFDATSQPDVLFHPIIMYHLNELQSQVSLNDLFHAYRQQQQVFELLGMEKDTESTQQNAQSTASGIVKTGLFGFLKGLGIDPWQIWIFLCCSYVTIIVILKLCFNYQKIAQLVQVIIENICATCRRVRGYTSPWLINNNRSRAAIVTTPQAQSTLGLQTAVIETQIPLQVLTKSSEASDDSFEPYNLAYVKTTREAGHSIQTLVNGISCNALFDTGAAFTLASQTFVNKIAKSSGKKFDKIQHKVIQARSASGHILPITDVVQCTIQVGKFKLSGPLAVAEQLPHELILGRDYIEQLGPVTVDYKTGYLKTKGATIPLINKSGIGSHSTVALIDTVTLPPFTECVVPGRVQSATKAIRLIEANMESLDRTGVNVASMIAIPTDQKAVPLRLMNTLPYPVQLYKGAKIATDAIIDAQQNESIDTQLVDYTQKSTNTSNAATAKFKHLDLSKCSLSTAGKTKLRSLLSEYEDVFSEGDNDLGKCTIVSHKIDTANSAPIRQKPYRTAFALRDVIKEKIQEMLKNGIIEPSTSEWSSPIVLVKKKDGTWRFCVDYRKLNAVTKKDSYPMKRIDDIMGSLDKAKLFCTLDMQSGYHQISMHPDSKEKTAFVTQEGLFQFKKLPFGLTNAPGTFQRLMESVLAGLDWRTCLVYLDDILVIGASEDELLERLRQILNRLRLAGLKLKLKKCTFGEDKVPYLGHILSKDGFFPECAKVEKIVNWPTPKSNKEVLAFLGLSGYYREFVPNYAMIAAPLYALQRKDAKSFFWSKECQTAFSELKTQLASSPILSFPNFTKPFVVQTDASDFSIGAVLSQHDDKGEEHPVYYASRVLNRSERRYSAVEKETLAVVWAIQTFRPYLYGRSFSVLTDHQPLQWLLGAKDPHGRICRWSLTLQSYDMTIFHRPGRYNRNADSMSRYPHHQDDTPDAKPEKCEICTDLCQKFQQQTTEHETATGKGNDILATTGTLPPLSNVMVEAQSKDTTCKAILAYIRNSELPNLPSPIMAQLENFFERDGLLYKKSTSRRPVDQLYVSPELRDEVLNACHDHQLGGHFGVRKTFNKVADRYYWPSCYTNVKNWCLACEVCASRKPPAKRMVPPLHPIPATSPWYQVSCDILGPLTTTKDGNKYIVCFVDFFTKWIECFAMKDTKSATLANVFVAEIICRYGVPQYLLTDQGPNLVSELMQETCRLLGVKKLQTCSYHPACNGLVERCNRTIKTMLSLYVNTNQDNWDNLLPYITFAYRSAVNDTTDETPFFLNYGRDPRLPLDSVLFPAPNAITDTDNFKVHLVDRLSSAWEAAAAAISKNQEKQKQQHDSRIHPKQFTEGDKVYMHVPIVGKGKTYKLARPWRGPFRITRISSDGTGAILEPCRPTTHRQQKRVNVRRLKHAPQPSCSPWPAITNNLPHTENREGASRANGNTMGSPVGTNPGNVKMNNLALPTHSTQHNYHLRSSRFNHC